MKKIPALLLSLMLGFIGKGLTEDISLLDGSGFDALFGGVLYWLASLTPLKKYMLRDRDDLEIV